MKLVSFQVSTPVGQFVRVGAIHDSFIVDLNLAHVRMLADAEEARPYRLAQAQVPSTMLEFLEGGRSTMAAARQALDHVIRLGDSARGPQGETIFHAGAGEAMSRAGVRLLAPLPTPPSLPGLIEFEGHIA